MKYYYNLKVPHDKLDPKERPQYYFANNIFGLLWQVFTHRLGHLVRDKAWKD